MTGLATRVTRYIEQVSPDPQTKKATAAQAKAVDE